MNLLQASLFLLAAISVTAIPTPKSAVVAPNVITYAEPRSSDIDKRHHHWTPIELIIYDLNKVDSNMNTFTDSAQQYTGGFWAAVHIAQNLKHMSKYIQKADKSSKNLDPISAEDSVSLLDMIKHLHPDTEAALDALKGKKDMIQQNGYQDKLANALVALQDIYTDLSQNVIEQIDESKGEELKGVLGKIGWNIKDALAVFRE